MRRWRSVGAASGAAVAALTLVNAVVVMAPLATGSPMSAHPVAWVLGGMQRVLPTAPPRDGVSARVTAAKGETEPFQVAVSAVDGRLTNATLRLSPLTGPGAARIPVTDLVRYREHFIYVAWHSPNYAGAPLRRHRFPDALIPFIDPVTGRPPRHDARFPASPFDVPAGHTQPLWVDVRVPRTASAGTYSGRWTVTSDQGTASGTVTLLVRDFALPRTPAADSAFLIERSVNRTRPVEQLLLRYGVQPVPVTPRHEAGLAGRGLRSVDLGFWSGAQIDHCEMSPPPSLAVLRRAVREQLPSLRLYNFTADEISRCKSLYPRVRAWARRLHAAGVDQLITMVPVRALLHDGAGRLGVDIFTLLPEQFQRLDPRIRSSVLDRGGQLWSYQALVQGRHTPSWEIDFPGANYRILPGFLNARMGVRGVLYWAVDYWQHDPWRDVEYTDSGCCYPGEGTLVYPGREAGVVGVVPSIRLAWIRQGIDDYGYVQKLRSLGQGALARHIINPAAHSWTRWTQRPAVLNQVRDRLAAAIQRHSE